MRTGVNRIGTVCMFAALVASAGCFGSGGTKNEVVGPTSPWIRPSPILEQQLRDEAERLPWTHGFERLEQIRWLASVGEPGYDTVLQLAADPREDVAAAALAALGATLDRRLVPHIQALPIPSDASIDLRLERGRTLARLGDWSEIPTLIEGLTDERVYTRALCVEALRKATREDCGFDPRASENAREIAAERWEKWWLARTGEGILNGS